MVDKIMKLSTLSTGDEEMVKSHQIVMLKLQDIRINQINRTKQMSIGDCF